MRLYFKQENGKERFICDVNTQEQACVEIDKFLEVRNYKSYYKIGNIYEDYIEFDVGSHAEFFILYLK